MLDEVRRYVRDGVQAVAAAGPDDLFERVQGLAAQAASFATMMAQWWTEARDSLLREVRDVVARQVEDMGLATKQDVETLRRRLDRLEAETPPAPARKARATSARTAVRKSRTTTARTPARIPARKARAASAGATPARTTARRPRRRTGSSPGSGSSDTPVTG